MAAPSSYHSRQQSLNSEGVAAEWLLDRTCVVPVECGGCVLGLGAELCVFACCVAQTSIVSSHILRNIGYWWEWSGPNGPYPNSWPPRVASSRTVVVLIAS